MADCGLESSDNGISHPTIPDPQVWLESARTLGHAIYIANLTSTVLSWSTSRGANRQGEGSARLR